MSRDKGILAFFWLLSIVLLIKLVPANKIRYAVVPFLFKQIITWLFGLLVAENKLIKYPVREFRRAYKGSFSFEYFLYPSLCAIFNLYYPERRSKLIKFFYTSSYTGLITIAEVLIERYTKLIKYVKWKWYWSYLTLLITNFSSRLFYKWFFKEDLKAVNSK